MSRVSRLLRRSPAASEGAPGEPPARPPRPPTPGQLRRERRALMHSREERIRDLGGIMLEMYKRDRFNDELVTDRCSELVALEERLRDVDAMLAQAALARRAPAGSIPCVCGAPVIPGTHFCANCGRPVGETAVIACAQCGSPLPAEAVFCARCGSPTASGTTSDAPRPDPDPEPEPQAQA